MKRNSLIDLFRFVCAFLVVLIHFQLPGDVFKGVIFPITRMAVPFFFMVSGYCLADENMERMKQRMNKQIRNIFRLFAGAFVAFFVFRFILIAVQNPSGAQNFLSALWNWDCWYRLIAVSDTSGFPVGHLWYLPALLSSIVAVRLALEYHEPPKMYWVAAILGLLLVPLLIWNRSPHGANAPLVLLRNGLFTGFPCLMAGVWIKCNTRRILKWPRKLVIILPIVFALLTVGERWLIYALLGISSLTTFFNGLLLAASMIVLSIHFPEAGARTPFPKWGAKYSLMIYICHMGFIDVMNVVAKLWGIQSESWYRWSGPFILLLLSLGFAALWEGTKDKLKQRKQAKIAAQTAT